MPGAEDERVGRVLALAAGEERGRRVTEAVAARLCDRDTAVLATAESALRLWGLIVDEPGVAGDPPAVLARPDRRRLAARRRRARPPARRRGPGAAAPESLESWPVGEVAGLCRPRRGQDQPDPTRVVVRGRIGSGRRSFAAAVWPSSACVPSMSTPTGSPPRSGRRPSPWSSATPSSTRCAPCGTVDRRCGRPGRRTHRCSRSSCLRGPAERVDPVVGLARRRGRPARPDGRGPAGGCGGPTFRLRGVARARAVRRGGAPAHDRR